MELRKPQDARSGGRSESPSPTSSSQKPSESEVERLAQLPNQSITTLASTEAFNGTNAAYTARSTNLRSMYVRWNDVKYSYSRIIGQLYDLLTLLREHPTYRSPRLHPLVIHDMIDEIDMMMFYLRKDVHELRFIMWRTNDANLMLSEPDTAKARIIARKLRDFRLLQPHGEVTKSKVMLEKAFDAHDRWCRRRGRDFLREPLRGMGRRLISKRKPTLSDLLCLCTRPWPEYREYLVIVTSSHGPGRYLVVKVGRTWNYLVFAVQDALATMRDIPNARHRSRNLQCVLTSLFKEYRILNSVLYEHNSLLDASSMSNILDSHDEPDFPTEALSMASASDSIAAEDQEDIRTRSRMANSRTLGNPERQSHNPSEKAAGSASETERARDGPIQRASNWRPASDGTASKAVLKQSTKNAARRWPTERFANIISPSQNGQHQTDFREHELNHKPFVMAETSEAETTRKSSGKPGSISKRPRKGHKRSDLLHEPTRTSQTAVMGSPQNDFTQINLPPRCGSSPRQSKRSKASDSVKGSDIRRVKSERTLSQSTISALQVERAVQRKGLSRVRITKSGSLKIDPVQRRATHCSPSDAPPTDIELELPSTLLGSSSINSCSPLGYRITDTVLEDASSLDQEAKSLHWEYTLYRSPHGEKVKVHYCKTKADAERIARLFFDEEVLGFDIEWKPNATAKEGIKKNVALIQIASEERIALFHIARFRGEDAVEDLVTPTFKYIMQTPRITKVGVSIKADCTRLRRYLGIESQGLFELSHLYKLVKYSPSNASSVDKRLVRLATQVEEHLGLPLWKGQDVRGSDWSAADLNHQQVQCK